MYYLSIALLFFSSCNKNKAKNDDPTGVESGDVIDLRLELVIVDDQLQDRLNPESPAYIGDKIQLYIRDGDIKTVLVYQDESIIQPPLRWTERYGYINQNTLGYYFIRFPWTSLVGDDNFSICYLHYPDGSEDEIKVQTYENENGTILRKDKIWVNGELAFEFGHWGVKDFYYNPKFYPWLEPLLDDDGNPISYYVRPKNGTDIIVIKK